MKRALAFVLGTLLAFATPMFAMASGTSADSDLLSNPYLVTYADMENATGKTATPDDSTDDIWHGIYDSGEADHGKVFMIEASGWNANTKGVGVEYTFGEKTQSLFHETLKPDSYYMFSYDYKNILTENSTIKLGGYFYFAPQVDAYYSVTDSGGDEWKDVPPASVDKWSTRTGVFGTGSKTSFSAKINTANTHTTTYIDNFSIIELAKINLNTPNDVKLDTNGTGIFYDRNMDSYFAVKGTPATIKILGVAAGESVTSASHGENELTAINGKYTIPSVTDGVEIDFAFSKESFEKANGVMASDNNLYVQMGKTLPQVLASWGVALDTVEFTDSEGQAITSLVSPIIAGSSLSLKYGEEVKGIYTLKYIGDINSDNNVSVSDVVSLADTIISDDYKIYADLNGSGLCTVSDIITLRELIFNPPSTTKLPEKFRVLGIGNSFSVDGMQYLYEVAKAYGYKDEDIALGNLYIGGCSLESHWGNAEANAAEYTYYRYDIEKAAWKGTADQTMLTGIVDEDWDYISFQQASPKSGQIDTIAPYLDNLIDYVNKNKTNPDAKFMWHSTWAYSSDCTNSGFKNYNNDQATMYSAIIEVAKHVLINYAADIQIMIPSGTAIQNMRSIVGDYLNRDGYHLDYNYGRLTASITWFKTITGANLEGIETDEALLAICDKGAEALAEKGVTITSEELLASCIASAEAAVESPYAATTIE